MDNKKTDRSISDIFSENIQINEEISSVNLEIKKVTEEISKIDIDIYVYENTLNTAEKDLMNDVDEQLKNMAIKEPGFDKDIKLLSSNLYKSLSQSISGIKNPSPNQNPHNLDKTIKGMTNFGSISEALDEQTARLKNDLSGYETRNELDIFKISNEYTKINNRNVLLKSKLKELNKKRLLLVQKKKILKQKLKMNKKSIQMFKKNNKKDNSINLSIELDRIEKNEIKNVKQKKLMNILKRNK